MCLCLTFQFAERVSTLELESITPDSLGAVVQCAVYSRFKEEEEEESTIVDSHYFFWLLLFCQRLLLCPLQFNAARSESVSEFFVSPNFAFSLSFSLSFDCGSAAFGWLCWLSFSL